VKAEVEVRVRQLCQALDAALRLQDQPTTERKETDGMVEVSVVVLVDDATGS
jgi:hypothetical protein